VNAKKQKPKMVSGKITGKGDADSKSIKAWSGVFNLLKFDLTPKKKKRAAQPSSDKKKSLKWHIFVGRLDSTTTAEEVSEYLTIIDNRGLNARWCLTPLLLSYLTESGISVLECNMLKKTEEWHKNMLHFGNEFWDKIGYK